MSTDAAPAARTVWSALATGANAVYFLSLIPIITKLGGVEAYGLWEWMTVLVGLLAPVAWLGLRSGFTRYSAGTEPGRVLSANVHAVLVVVVPAALVLGGLELAASPVIAREVFEGDDRGAVLLRVAAVLLAVEAVHLVVLEVYRATMRIRTYAAILLVQRTAELTAIVVLLATGRSIVACAVAAAAIRLVALMVAYGGVLVLTGFARPDLTRIRPFMIFGLPLLANEFLGRVLKAADRLVIGTVWGADAVGAYAVPFNMGMVFLLYTATLQVWLYPHLSGLWNRGERERAAQVLDQSLRFFYLIGLPTVVGMASLGPALVQVVSSADVALRTAALVPLLQTGLFCYGVASLTLYALTLVERTGVITWVLLAAVPINLVVNLVAVPRLGILGGGLASLSGFAFMAVVMAVVARRHLPVQVVPGGWQLPRALLACAAMAAVVWGLGGEGLLRLLLAIVAGAVTYAAVLLVTRCVTVDEVRSLLVTRGARSSPGRT